MNFRIISIIAVIVVAAFVLGPALVFADNQAVASVTPDGSAENSNEGATTPPAQLQAGNESQVTPPTGGENADEGEVTAQTGAENNTETEATPPTGGENADEGSTTPPASGENADEGAVTVAASGENEAEGSAAASGNNTNTTVDAGTFTGGGGSYVPLAPLVIGNATTTATSTATTTLAVTATTTPVAKTPVIVDQCRPLTKSLRFGQSNDNEIVVLQTLLNKFNTTQIAVTGTFDRQTLNSVREFQAKHSADVLAPWGATQPSGFVYITTIKKLNQLNCNSFLTLNASEQAIIAAYRARATAVSLPTTPAATSTAATSTPAVNQEIGSTQKNPGFGTQTANAFGAVMNSIGGFFSGLFD